MDEFGWVVEEQTLRVDISHEPNKVCDGVLMDARIVAGHSDHAL